jgi:hypothetical protein
MNINEKILEILHDFEEFKFTNDEQGVYAKTTSYMPFIDRIKALSIPVVVGQSEQLNRKKRITLPKVEPSKVWKSNEGVN